MIRTPGTVPRTVLYTILSLLENDEVDNSGYHSTLPDSYYAEKEKLLSGKKAGCRQVKALIDRYKRSPLTGFTRSGRKPPVIPPVIDITRKHALIRFYDFSADTADAIRERLAAAGSVGKLVIDLSVNAGGNVDACARLLSLLLETGTPLFRLEYSGKVTEYRAQDTRKLRCDEIELITSPQTVSSAEIFTECLFSRFPGKIHISGGKTFGKKTGQNTFRFRAVRGWELRLNSFIWRIPAPECPPSGEL